MRLPLTVTIQTPATYTTGYGDTAESWDAPATRTADGWIDTVEATESDTPGRDQRVTRFLLITSDPDLAASERVVHAGVTYRVDGRPRRVMTGRGPHHTEARLLLVEG